MSKKLIIGLTPHWYFITNIECPLCLSIKTYRERIYGKKPDHYGECHKNEIAYDWCDI